MTKTTDAKPSKPKIDFPTVEEIFPVSIVASMRTVASIGLPAREMPDSMIPFVLRLMQRDQAKLKPGDDPYAPWFPVDETTGGADEVRTRKLFDGWRALFGTNRDYWDYVLYVMKWPSDKVLPDDQSLMAYMCHAERDPSVSPNGDIHDIGGAHFFGGHGRKIDPEAKLRGCLWIGRNVTIRPAKVNGPALVGHGALIDSSVTLTRSIVGDNTTLEEGVRAKDAIIGSDVVIMSGTKLENKPLMKGPITLVDFRDDRKLTHVLAGGKRGVRIGDGCRLGSGVTVGAGTILLAKCVVPSGTNLRSGIYSPEMLRAMHPLDATVN